MTSQTSLHYHLHQLKICDSTQTEVRERLHQQSDIHSGVIVQTLHQRKGRGRQTRTWKDSTGSLLFSLGRYLPFQDNRLLLLPYALGIAVRSAIVEQNVSSGDIELKWPNDILTRTQDGVPGKAGGLLIELEFQQGSALLIAGVGLNLAPPLPSTIDLEHQSEYPPQSIWIQVDEALKARVLKSIVRQFDHLVSKLEAGETQHIIDTYSQHCETIGKTVAFDEGDRFKVMGIESDGALRCTNREGQVILKHSGEITHTL